MHDRKAMLASLRVTARTFEVKLRQLDRLLSNLCSVKQASSIATFGRAFAEQAAAGFLQSPIQLRNALISGKAKKSRRVTNLANIDLGFCLAKDSISTRR